jgi:hypothetical protein
VPTRVLTEPPHATGPATAAGRPAEGVGPCQAQERGDQGESARPRVRCLGFRPLSVGNGLDTRIRLISQFILSILLAGVLWGTSPMGHVV